MQPNCLMHLCSRCKEPQLAEVILLGFSVVFVLINPLTKLNSGVAYLPHLVFGV